MVGDETQVEVAEAEGMMDSRDCHTNRDRGRWFGLVVAHESGNEEERKGCESQNRNLVVLIVCCGATEM